MEQDNQLRKVEAVEPVSPLVNAAALVASNKEMDVDKLGKLLEMQERFDATQAKKSYMVAMAEFKKNPPEILKDKTVRYKEVKYSHSSLHNVTTCINKALSEHGLAASWVTGQDNGSVKVTCKITHIMGHGEETCLSAPPDATGSKNAIQAIGSTVTYLQRYTLLALTGLATYDQDDDGKGADKPAEIKEPTKKEQAVIDAICDKLDPPDGMVVDKAKVIAIGYASAGHYPDDPKKIDCIVEWYLDHHKREIFKPADNFEDHYQLDQQEQPPETMPKTSMRKCNKAEGERMKALVQLQLEKAIRLEVIDSMREMTAGEKTAFSQLVWDAYSMWPDSDDEVLEWNADINPKHYLKIPAEAK